jgi:F-type H+-transporting ATPase subunit delta
MNQIAQTYAEALFSLGLEDKKLTKLQDEGKTLSEIIHDNEDFLLLIDSRFMSREERQDIASKILKDFDEDIVNFVKVLIANNRTNYIKDVLEAFNSLCNEYKGVKEGLIYSAFPLDKEIINKIKNKISQIEGMDVELISRIDPSLIGGVKVVINSHVYDGSIKNQLEKMQIDLLGKEL